MEIIDLWNNSHQNKFTTLSNSFISEIDITTVINAEIRKQNNNTV